jgi:hypothetical protein
MPSHLARCSNIANIQGMMAARDNLAPTMGA